MEFDKREQIEWLNYWIENANESKKRIILIGDSVTRDLRKKMNFYLNKSYAIDLLAMSYCILDDMVIEEISHYFQSSQYQYDYIIYQMGAHHGYYVKCCKSEEDSKKFESRIKAILCFFKKYSANVVAVSSTFENCFDNGNKNVRNCNEEIEKRNQLLGMVAEKLQISFLDLGLKLDYNILKYSDRFHFSDKAYENIARTIIMDIFPEIQCISSNQVETLQELNEKLEQYQQRKIYVYGNGIKGNLIRGYLKKYRFDGFIVSNEYFEISDEIFMISQIDKEQALIIVTPYDLNIWEKLAKSKYNYITLHTDIYTFFQMYVDY